MKNQNLFVSLWSLRWSILAMAVLVVASNILVQFVIPDMFLTWGAFTYPIAFLVTDLTNRIYGAAQARKVVFGGLIVGIVCSFIGTQIQGEFGPLVTWRIALGSATAFFVAQMTDIFIFQTIQDRSYDREWKKAPLVSSLIGSVLDTAIFFFIAFSATSLSMLAVSDDGEWALEDVPLLGFGPVLPLWVSLAVADWAVKFGIALIALIPFRLITVSMRTS